MAMIPPIKLISVPRTPRIWTAWPRVSCFALAILLIAIRRGNIKPVVITLIKSLSKPDLPMTMNLIRATAPINELIPAAFDLFLPLPPNPRSAPTSNYVALYDSAVLSRPGGRRLMCPADSPSKDERPNRISNGCPKPGDWRGEIRE